MKNRGFKRPVLLCVKAVVFTYYKKKNAAVYEKSKKQLGFRVLTLKKIYRCLR